MLSMCIDGLIGIASRYDRSAATKLSILAISIVIAAWVSVGVCSWRRNDLRTEGVRFWSTVIRLSVMLLLFLSTICLLWLNDVTFYVTDQ